MTDINHSRLRQHFQPHRHVRPLRRSRHRPGFDGAMEELERQFAELRLPFDQNSVPLRNQSTERRMS